MTVLVDGAGGFLGRRVVAELGARGHRVRATYLPGAELPERPGVESVHADLRTDSLDPLLEGVDRVVHVAGLFDLSAPPARLMAVNEAMAQKVARACAFHGVERLIHVSSVTVYGRPRRTPAHELTPFRPDNWYERSKAAGEEAVRDACDGKVPLVVVRPSGIYGPHGRYGLAALFALYALAGATGKRGGLRAFRGGPRMTHVHVDDVAGAIGHLLEAPGVEGRAFNVADDTPLAWGDLMAHLERWLDVDAGPPQRLTPRGARWLARLWTHLPESRRAKVNAGLERRWNALVEERELVPALVPRLDRHAYDYFRADHVYANDELRATGYRLRHPDAVAGLRSTLDWYRRERWLP